jgi:hypothetical protein
VSTGVTAYSDRFLTPNTTYWYRVRAYNGVGNSGYAGPVGIAMPITPAAPSNLTAVAVSSNQVNLGWTDNATNETGFAIERAPGNNSFAQIATVISNVTNYSDLGVTTNKTYQYRVRAYNVWGCSGYSSVASVTVPAFPFAPSGLTATAVATNQVNLVWRDNSNNETGFKIERALDNVGSPGTWSQITTVLSNLTTYSDTGLAGTTRYWYRIRATNVSGDSPYSNLANASTAAGTNVWINPLSDKWETAPNWSQGFPNSAQAGLLVTNPTSTTITIDATTAASNAVNQCLTVGNLTIFSPAGATNTLSLASSGPTNPLHVVNSLIVTNGGAISITNAALQVGGTLGIDGSLLLQPNGTAALGTLTVAANPSSAGTFTLTGGSMISSNTWFGAGSNSSASVWLTGGSFTATNRVTYALVIGGSGNAQITVSNGATLNTYTTQLANGAGSTGTLTVAGGSVTMTGLTVGYGSNAFGAAWVSGGVLAVTNGIDIAGSSFAVGQMTVSNGTVSANGQANGIAFLVGGGLSSIGTFTMEAGTLMSMPSNVFWIVGASGGSQGFVWIDGGQITSSNGTLIVGESGSGQWTSTNGSVTVSNLYVLAGAPSSLVLHGGSFSVLGNTTVDSAGTGSVWVTGGQFVAPNGPFVLGDYDPGVMTVSNGLAVIRSMIISSNNTPYGSASGSTLNVAGGQVAVFDSLVVGDCASNAIGQITVSGGTLYVTNATHTGYLDLRDGTLTVSSGGALVADVLVMTNSCGRIIRSSGGTIAATTLTLDPSLSAVGDGIPNGWKQQYGLDPLDPNLANEDPDGTGFTVLQDYLVGVDPTNPAAAFCITSVVPSGIDLLVTWMMGSGRTNALQATAGDVNGGYTTNNFSDIFIVTNTVGTTTNYLDTGAATNGPARYYRVRLVP